MPRQRMRLLLHSVAVSPEKLGQHFLADAAWRERIARAIGIDGGLWIEIGAGHGEMTPRLAADRRPCDRHRIGPPALLPGLRKLTAPLAKRRSGGRRCAGGRSRKPDARTRRFSAYGNLPYYITSPILHRLFEHAERIAAIHIVIQLEVAERIVAMPGRRDYGYLSVVSQWFSRVRNWRCGFRPPRSRLLRRSIPRWSACACPAPARHPWTPAMKRNAPRFREGNKFPRKRRKTLKNNLRVRLGTRAEADLSA